MTAPVSGHDFQRGIETSVDLLAERELNTLWGRWREHAFVIGEKTVIALTLGAWAPGDRVLVRVHSTCLAAHYLASTECDCREQLSDAYASIAAHGAGAVVVLEQDGRANGHVALMRAAEHAKAYGTNQSEAYTTLGYPPDSRTFWIAAKALQALGITAVDLLSNNARKIADLEELGLDVQSVSAQIASDSPEAREFYRHKALEGYLNVDVDST